jgi:hypothetical protein
MSFKIPTKPLTINPPGKPKGNAVLGGYYAVSPEIAIDG